MTTDMNDELKAEALDKAHQYIAGNLLESEKFEVKNKWHPLREEGGLQEFLKDCSAMANSPGQANGFIIFGIHDKTKELRDAVLSESGYNDSAHIVDIVKANVDRPFNFAIDQISISGKNLGLIIIFPSMDKPHVILNYKLKCGDQRKTLFTRNIIYTKKSSTVQYASKADLDIMYMERKYIEIERRVSVSVNLFDLKVQIKEGNLIQIERPVLIENMGFRPLTICVVVLQLSITTKDPIELTHLMNSYYPICLQPNSVFNAPLNFELHVKEGEASAAEKILNDALKNVSESTKSNLARCFLILGDGERIEARLTTPTIKQKPRQYSSKEIYDLLN